MNKNSTHRNRPVATLLRDFCNKRSKKVAVSREELKKRFLYLDWAQQKKIALAFLASGLTDRKWIYRQILYNELWDKVYEPQIKQNWEEHHENECSWLVIRFMPEDYVWQEFDHLIEGFRNYFHICYRFANKPDFVIDKDKLTPYDYIRIMQYNKLSISDKEALVALLMQLKMSLQLTHSSGLFGRLREHSSREPFGAFNLEVISHMHRLLAKMNNHAALWTFLMWDEHIKQLVADSNLYTDVLKNKDDNFYISYDIKFAATDYYLKAIDNFLAVVSADDYKLANGLNDDIDFNAPPIDQHNTTPNFADLGNAKMVSIKTLVEDYNSIINDDAPF